MKKIKVSHHKQFGIEVLIDNEKKANTIFVADSGDYIRFTDKDKEYIKLKDDGIYITEKLAENEGLKLGDKLKWHIYGDDTYYESEIIGLDRDPQNQNLKMTRKYLEELGIEYTPDTYYTNKEVADVKELKRNRST